MCTNFQHYRTKNAKIEKIAQIGAKIPKNTQKRPQNQKLIKHTSFVWPNEDMYQFSAKLLKKLKKNPILAPKLPQNYPKIAGKIPEKYPRVPDLLPDPDGTGRGITRTRPVPK